MSEPPENLLLRIRAETLRLNLDRAHANLKDLPSISEHVEEIHDLLAKARKGAQKLGANVADFCQTMRRNDTPIPDAVTNAQTGLDNLVRELATALTKLEVLNSNSFLTKIGPIGQSIWECLDGRAIDLRADVKAIEDSLSHPYEAWKALAKAEADANELVFKESVELLGGFALRDTGLDEDICELADGLIQSIHASAGHLSVIPGGIGSMMMTIERIIRLPFTE
jgi:hypothetical protein